MKSKKLRKVYVWPVVLALLSLVGLLSALLGDKIWDQLSWLSLGIPTGLCLWIMLGAPRSWPEKNGKRL